METHANERSIISQSRMAALAADLRQLVDQLESDCRAQRPLDQELADELHTLLARAKLLFSDF